MAPHIEDAQAAMSTVFELQVNTLERVVDRRANSAEEDTLVRTDLYGLVDQIDLVGGDIESPAPSRNFTKKFLKFQNGRPN